MCSQKILLTASKDVSQGSVPGPLLFVIYISHLNQNTNFHFCTIKTVTHCIGVHSKPGSLSFACKLIKCNFCLYGALYRNKRCLFCVGSRFGRSRGKSHCIESLGSQPDNQENQHLESLQILLRYGIVYWREESSQITLKLLGLDSGFIFTPVYQPDCSSDPGVFRCSLHYVTGGTTSLCWVLCFSGFDHCWAHLGLC